MYGPTETTIWSLIHRVQPGIEKKTSHVAIGKPIANTSAFLLGEQRQPLPIGVPGELFLGGLGLAKGYRSQPQKTEDRFNSVESVGGLRLYRTGDVGVRRPDGTIEIFGRTDNQVKVRGHRVELEAVESAVLRHPCIAAAAARVWPEATGNSRLSVYIVATDDGPAPSLSELRAFLGNTLTESMIPSDVIPLPAIPLTAHGKIDRTRLPEPSTSKTSRTKTPGSSEERRLAMIWSDLLGRNHVGLHDNFFDLGGHSVLVVALQQRIVHEFGLRIPVAELFHWPTVRQQAALMLDAKKGKPELPPGVLALQPPGAQNRIFWMHTLNRNLAEAIGSDQPFLCLVLTAEDISSLGKSPTLEDIAACHLRKILTTQPEGPYTLGGFCAQGVLAYEIASQLQAVGQEVSLVILLDSQNPSYRKPRDTLSLKLNYLRYGIQRLARIGTQSRLVHFRLRWRILWRRLERIRIGGTELRTAYEMVETAASRYHPETYDGKVLLLLASDRPPDVDPLPGWQAIVPRNLHSQYVNGHHSELLKAPYVRGVADAIASHLASESRDASPLYRAEASRPTRSGGYSEVNDEMALSEG
jgi:thioesterase domain-containing protein